MELILKENIVFKTYDKKIQLNEEIIDFIMENKIDRVLYKGDHNEINYKLLKKIIPLSDSKESPELVRKKYQNILELSDNQPFCIIYRK